MSSPLETDSAPDATERGSDRRQHQRHMGKAIVEVIRESDSRRINLPVELVDISICGVGLYAIEPFAPDDRVKVRLRNDIRKFVREMHGVVRWAQLTDEGKFRVGIELNSRFSAIEMQILKEFGLAGGLGRKIWV
jgi:hypothetical protein